MAYKAGNRVRQTSTGTGTGPLTLIAAATGFQNFSSEFADGDTCPYLIDDGAGNWELGNGTFATAGPTLTRTTVKASSNGGSAVNFPAGNKTVSCELEKTGLVYLDSNGLPCSHGNASGTFVPTLTFGGAFVGGSLSFALGNFVKIGKLVTFNLKVTINAKGSSTGTAVIGGLPFASANADPFWPVAIYCDTLNLAAGKTQFAAYVNKNTTDFSLLQLGDNVAASGFTDVDFTAATTTIILAGQYISAS